LEKCTHYAGKRIFRPKRDEMAGEWRKLHNEELRDLYSSPCMIRIIKSRRMRWVGLVARMGRKRTAYRLLVGKRRLATPRGGWVDNIRMDLELGWGDVNWCGLQPEDAPVITGNPPIEQVFILDLVMHLNGCKGV
jgi:hypothetical protein